MCGITSSLKRLLHPFLLGAYAVLALLAHNIDQIKPSVALRPLIVTIAMTAALLLMFKIILRDWDKAGLACSLTIVLIFSYGHLYGILKTTSLLGITIGRHRYLIVFYSALLGLGILWVKRRREVRKFGSAVGAMAIVALAFPIVQLATFGLGRADRESTALQDRPCRLRIPAGQVPPDIYYIVFDAYSRDDVLRDIYGFDNSSFLDHLAKTGFYVASGSQSNYPYTELSLASSLNMDYLNSPKFNFDEDSHRYDLVEFILHNQVRHELECVGYTTVAFETGYYWTQWEDATVYLDRKSEVLYKMRILGGVSDFEAMLIETSVGRVLTDAANVLPNFLVPDVKNPLRDHRERIVFVLDRLSEVSAIESPKFVFAHIVSPHRPYVLDPQGEFVDDRAVMASADSQGSHEPLERAYRDQVAYLNERIAQFVSDIFAGSETPVVIILQGDHSNSSRTPGDRVSILNMFYLPGSASTKLYPTITPVNTFRLVFNEYLDGNYSLLEDISYYSSSKDSFDFSIVPNESLNRP